MIVSKTDFHLRVKKSVLTDQGSLFMGLPPISKNPLHVFHNLDKNHLKETRSAFENLSGL